MQSRGEARAFKVDPQPYQYSSKLCALLLGNTHTMRLFMAKQLHLYLFANANTT